MKSMLVYYAQRGHFYAKQALLFKIRFLLISTAHSYAVKYKNMFTTDELIEIGHKVYYDCLKKYNFNKKAIFTTYFITSFKYKIYNTIRNEYTNKSIINLMAKKTDYQDFSGDILEDKKVNLELKEINYDLYQRIISVLKDEDKKIITLWAQGYAYKDIAQKYNKKTKWVDNKIKGIMTFLRNRHSNSLIK